MQVLRGNSHQQVVACKYYAEIPELTFWQQQVSACKYCMEIPELPN